MNLFDILKQFKNIEPDSQFTQRSKRDILLSPRPEKQRMRGVFAFLHIIETSAAVALAGFFILVFTGSFSGTHSIAPIQYAVIDPSGLHAEAQAIDMQIQLANVNYPQENAAATATVTGASTVATSTLLKIAFVKPIVAIPTSSDSDELQVAAATSSPSSSSSVSINQALQKLSQ